MNSGMTVRGISWCVPEKVETNELLVQEFGTWTPEKILHKTGIAERHVAEAGVPASYYHVMVANKFFEEHPDIARDTIDMLVICTETRDYIAPATACVVHGQLGLRKTCGAVDYELGCSGFLYGLGISKGFISAGIARRVLLITGDVVAKYANKMDKAIRTIFGDGFTATLLEASEADRVTGFDFGTDGTGFRDIIIEAGAEAMPWEDEEQAMEQLYRPCRLPSGFAAAAGTRSRCARSAAGKIRHRSGRNGQHGVVHGADRAGPRRRVRTAEAGHEGARLRLRGWSLVGHGRDRVGVLK